MKRPIIIDCDPGTDDAIALICAHLCKEIDVVGITTVSGNVHLKHTSQNALNLAHEIGWDVKVAKGLDKPLFKELKVSTTHGETGLGHIVLKKSNKDFYNKDACYLIYEQAKKYNGELELLVIGPMTNVAMALLRYPEIKKLIKGITFMGGAVVGGNVTLASEFNIYTDPEAAKIVFESGIPLTMVGLDVTLKAVLTEEDRDYFSKFDNPHAKLTTKLLDFMFLRSRKFGKEDAIMHDNLALAAMVLPNLIKKEKFYATVETKGEITTGMTVVDYYNTTKNKENVDVAMDVDVSMFKNWMKDLICY